VSDGGEIDPSVPPSGPGCVECTRSRGWWLHLRRCARCGHVGCCDTSPERHARRHFEETGHRVIASFEPGETWFYDFATDAYVDGADLAAPHAHPASQPVPGPHGHVPPNWRSLLNL
jgi:hypothetical protein